jgi:hypothetical protein
MYSLTAQQNYKSLISIKIVKNNQK